MKDGVVVYYYTGGACAPRRGETHAEDFGLLFAFLRAADEEDDND